MAKQTIAAGQGNDLMTSGGKFKGHFSIIKIYPTGALMLVQALVARHVVFSGIFMAEPQ